MRSIVGRVVWLVVCACGSSTGTSPARPSGPHGGPAPGGPAEVAAAPSVQECEQLLGHAVQLGVDERATRAPDQQVTEADRDAVRAQLQPFMDGCRQLARESYRCALAATSLDALAACQATLSSSTSNSSVAPGGMTPAAPRSP